MSALLEAKELECIRGERVLFSGLNFQLRPGQLLQIEGANGSGKTSLLRLLSGLGRPESGEVRWRGEPILERHTSYYGEMAYLGHHLGVKADLTPFENLQSSLALRSVSVRREAVVLTLGEVGLGGCADIRVRSLSAGQRQRVALARLRLTPSVLWILDEPFTALDTEGVGVMQRMLHGHLAKGGMAVFTSHQAVALGYPLVKLMLP